MVLGALALLSAVGVLSKATLPVIGLCAVLGLVAQAGIAAKGQIRHTGLRVARTCILLDGVIALVASLDGKPGGEDLWVLAALCLLADALYCRRWRILAGVAAAYLTIPLGAWAIHTATKPQALSAATAILVGAVVAGILSGLKSRDERLDRQERRLHSIVDSVSRLAKSPDLSTMLANCLKIAMRESNASEAYILLTDEEDPDRLVAEVACGGEDMKFPETLPVGEGLSGYVVQMRQLVAIDNTESKGDCDGIALGSRSAVSMPLMARVYQGTNANAGEQILGAMTVLGPEGRPKFDGADLQVLESVSSMMAVAVANARMENRQRTTFVRTLESLATALEARDEYTRGHSARVCEVSLMIGEALGFTPEVLEEVRIGTTLHDIGKIGVRDNILNKDSRLTDEEFAIMKSHPVIGYEICKPLMLSEGVLMIIRNHHEKLDGSGYPDGLKGGELPPPLRVVCVADAFDAMSSRRPYRHVMAMDKVLAELSRGAGVQFDPVIVETLKSLIDTPRMQECYRQYWGEEQTLAA